jgi:F-type H+-transporting ATPase subunit gamma
MPNLKDIRRRIKSVKSTQKITRAMRMVSAAKVKRAENRVKATRPYAAHLRGVFSAVYKGLRNHLPELAKSESSSRYEELLKPRPIKNLGIIVMTSDRGLCGSYNAAVIRQAFRLEKEILARGLTPHFFLVGSKAIQAFGRYSKSTVIGKVAHMTAAPSIQDANLIADTMVKTFLDGKIDSIDVLSTHFVSMISYKIQMMPIIPIRSLVDWEPELIPPIEAAYQMDSHHASGHPKAEMLLAPDPVTVLDKLVPMYLSHIVYTLLLEAAASELAARMTAMSNATTNAGQMLNRLTILYNKVRQAAITQEILEIVGGAEALK